MKLEQRQWTSAEGWRVMGASTLASAQAQVVLVFGGTAVLADAVHLKEIQKRYPSAQLFGCSTAGEICGTHVHDESLVTTAIRFEGTQVKGAQVKVASAADSQRAGEELAQAFDPHGLVHVFVLSDGLMINGTELVHGLTRHLPPQVIVTGGLSGDGARFQQTLVVCDGTAQSGRVAALGFYGTRLKVGHGSLGGWDAFGPERLITRSRGNVLYQLDEMPALGLYKKYLGKHAAGLPATGRLFPLSLRTTDQETGLVRTILAVNEEEQSLTFAGDMPQGAHTRLMKANFDRLINGAVGAAKGSSHTLGSLSPQLAILISCVGRKLVLKQRVEEEVEGVREVLGDRTLLAGFYSYGEISPLTPQARCELHNQTMTITVLAEV